MSQGHLKHKHTPEATDGFTISVMSSQGQD